MADADDTQKLDLSQGTMEMKFIQEGEFVIADL